MNVGELIEYLKTQRQDLPVYYVMFDDGYNVTEVTPKDVISSSTLENKEGKEFPCIIIGEGWLI
jgi:hypothetical protein